MSTPILGLQLDGHEFCARQIMRKVITAGKHGVAVYWQPNDCLRIVQPHSIRSLNKGPRPLLDENLIWHYKRGIEINEIEDDLIFALRERSAQ